MPPRSRPRRLRLTVLADETGEADAGPMLVALRRHVENVGVEGDDFRWLMRPTRFELAPDFGVHLGSHYRRQRRPIGGVVGSLQPDELALRLGCKAVGVKSLRQRLACDADRRAVGRCRARFDLRCVTPQRCGGIF